MGYFPFMEISADWLSYDFEQIIRLYDSVGWHIYTKDPEKLREAFRGSDRVLVASEGGEVVGIARSVSDGISIHYLQDILVSPDCQKRGIGKQLLENMLNHYKDVRTHMILTDDEEKQKFFYQSLGYSNIKNLTKHKLNTYIKMNGVTLE